MLAGSTKMWWLVAWTVLSSAAGSEDLWDPESILGSDTISEDLGLDEFWSEWDWEFEEEAWTDWGDFDWLIERHSEPPSAQPSAFPDDLFSFNVLENVKFDKFWTGDEGKDWCRRGVPKQPVSDMQVAVMISDFLESGNITNWCIYPDQVMVISDLSHLNLNDPNALPSLFQHVVGHCTPGVCDRQMERQKQLDATALVTRVWQLMEVYNKLKCRECFCDSQEKKDLELVMAITKDHLKNNEFLRYNTTAETPPDVTDYYNKRKQELGLDNLRLPPEQSYTTLYTMDAALDGPGAIAHQIDEYTQLTRGLWSFCQGV